MAGPLDIQRLPKGLIDLLGMKATGDAQHILSQEVSGGVDLKAEYLVDRLVGRRTSGAAAINATGTTAFLNQTVQPGFMWYLYGLSIEVSAPAAATALTLTLAVARGSLNVRNYVGPSTKLIAGEGNAWGVWFETPLIMLPTDSLCVFCSQVTGAPAVTVTGISWYSEVGI